MTLAATQATLVDRDPETLIGPLLFLFTRLANRADDEPVAAALGDQLLALALHPHVATPLRLAAGALALEYRYTGA